jgi:regulator of sigma E protease
MIITILIFLIVLGVLVFVHELGHFVVARAFGIRVDEFAIGFGPKLWSRMGKMKNGLSVLYSLRAIPFGGYVKIYGEDGDAGGPNSFTNKNRGIQALVLAAGIFFNFLFAWVLVSLVFMVGAPVSPDSYTQYATQIRNQHVIVDDTLPGSPAEKAGLKAGDAITSIAIAGANDQGVIKNPSVDQIQNTVNEAAGKSVLINGISVTPITGLVPEASTTYAIGIDMEDAATLQLPPWSAVWEGAKFTIYIVEATAQGVWGLIAGLFQGNHAVLSEVSGPVGIASLVGSAARVGIVSLLMLVSVISVNLGVLNLVPFPALDGGRILFVAIEAVIRRPIKPSVTNMVNTIGFGLLILLMIAVTYHDIATRL